MLQRRRTDPKVLSSPEGGQPESGPAVVVWLCPATQRLQGSGNNKKHWTPLPSSEWAKCFNMGMFKMAKAMQIAKKHAGKNRKTIV